MSLGLEVVAGLDATGHVQVAFGPEQQALRVGQATGAARDERPEEGAGLAPEGPSNFSTAPGGSSPLYAGPLLPVKKLPLAT